MNQPSVQRRWALLGATLALCLGPLFGTQTWGADPAPAPVAHVRFWKADLPDFPNLRVAFKSGSGRGNAKDLGSEGPGYAFGNYQDVPAGRGTLELFAGPDKKALASVFADFGSGTYFTVLLSEPEQKGGTPVLEALNDIPTKEAATQVTVRNFVRNLKSLEIKMGDSLSAKFITGHEYLRMRGFQAANYLIQTRGVDAEGKSFEWNTEADFRHSSKQTLLVYPDAYGRIRPRLLADGEANAPAEEVDASGQR